MLALASLAAAPASAAASASCALSATPLAFGRYVPSRNAPADFTATVSLTCTASGSALDRVEGTISLIGAAGPFGRAMADGPHRLRYQLFLDPAKMIPWGDGSGATRTISVSGVVGATTPLRRSYTIYGRLLARQTHTVVGDYRDRITVVLNY
ncbi:MAG TPA: spore coat protein U domain-containing protein [Sphingomicrobium sp.]|nr:spore coat protein U domain-containing protein [Sphingomicrobium sp.]